MADRFVPGSLVLLDINASELPQIEFGEVRAGTIAARDERRTLLLDGLERRHDVLAAIDAGGIALRPDQDEVVVHHRVALYAEAFGEEFFLGGLGVDEYDIGVTAATGIECLPGSLRDNLHIDTGLGLEQRQYVFEQT